MTRSDCPQVVKSLRSYKARLTMVLRQLPLNPEPWVGAVTLAGCQAGNTCASQPFVLASSPASERALMDGGVQRRAGEARLIAVSALGSHPKQLSQRSSGAATSIWGPRTARVQRCQGPSPRCQGALPGASPSSRRNSGQSLIPKPCLFPGVCSPPWSKKPTALLREQKPGLGGTRG